MVLSTSPTYCSKRWIIVYIFDMFTTFFFMWHFAFTFQKFWSGRNCVNVIFNYEIVPSVCKPIRNNTTIYFILQVGDYYNSFTIIYIGKLRKISLVSGHSGRFFWNREKSIMLNLKSYQYRNFYQFIYYRSVKLVFPPS